MAKVERGKARAAKPTAKSAAKTVTKARAPKSAPNSSDKSYPVSRREAALRRRLDDLNYALDDRRTRLTEISERKFAKLQQKITRARSRQEAELERQENSRLFAKSRILYALMAPLFALGRFFRGLWRKIRKYSDDLRTRRPHRSFYLTTGYHRRLKMRGYLGFVGEVWHLIWRNRWLFAKFLLLYAVFSGVIVGIMSQANFAALRDALSSANVVGLDKITALFSGALTGSGGSTDSGQQILAVLLFLYGWLILVWLLRRLANGDKVKLRDGLYSGGAPVLATLVILLVVLLQLLPFALVLLAYSSVTAVGWINSGIAIENMAAWCAMAIAAILTLYWICSSFVALIIVTLPGMYPFAALRAAGDLVTGRRLKLVLRLIFMALPLALMWLVILVPAILVDGWLKLSWQPLVPLVVLILTTLTIIWCAAYIYLLYRKMVDDPTPPVPSARDKRQAKKARSPKKSSWLVRFHWQPNAKNR